VDSAGTAAQIVVATDAEAGPPSAGLAAGSQLVSYSEFLTRQAGDPLPWSVPDELAPIAINYTSGTTGVPKGVIYTHRGDPAGADRACAYQDRRLQGAP
jgi:fatty-acyl-CoA synthase